MTAQEIVREIVAGNFTADEVRSFYDAYKFAANNLARKNAFTLRRGAQVKFTNSKGTAVQGVVADVKVKNVIVVVGNTRYRVPGSMQTAV